MNAHASTHTATAHLATVVAHIADEAEVVNRMKAIGFSVDKAVRETGPIAQLVSIRFERLLPVDPALAAEVKRALA